MEAVAIVSVVATAVVGLAATWGRGRELRWQTREERTTELRSVLDRACEKLTATFVVLDQAHREFGRAGNVQPVTQQLLLEADKQLVLECNRVGVRRGADRPEHVALTECREACGRVAILIDEMESGATPAHRAAYSTLWERAKDAEKRFFDVASAALDSDGRQPLWRRLRRAPSEPQDTTTG